jgi:polyhydroxyalkanoate synthesis regulator protein
MRCLHSFSEMSTVYLYNDNQQIIQLAVPSFLAISITTFIKKQEDIKNTSYLFAYV